MLEILRGLLYSPFAVPIVGIIVGVGVPIITCAWCELEKHREDCKLKRTMVERGMAVEEIERVLAATSSGKKKKKRGTRASSGDQPSSAVV